MLTTDNTKQSISLEKASKLNVLSTLVFLLGMVLHVFTDYSLIALTIFVIGLWLYTWALHLAPLYTFFKKDLRFWKRCRLILLIAMSIATVLLIVLISGKHLSA